MQNQTATTTENNVLIAKFMGGKPSRTGKGISANGKFHANEDLRYHSCWNWIMPVIEKCREKQIFGSQRLLNNIDNRLLKLDLIGTHRNILDFIQFYNQNQLNESK